MIVMTRLVHLVPTLILTAVTLRAVDEPLPFPDMAPTVGAFLEKAYYDPSRFHPRIMVERALRALETTEVTIDTRWYDQHIEVEIKDVTVQVPAPEPASLSEAMKLIEDVRKVVDGSSLPAEKRRDLDYVLVNGALSSLDPHTVLMPPEPAKEFGDSISGEFFGIGAWLTQDDGVIAIDRVMPGFPAERAGVEDGDKILAIDGERTAGLSLEQAVKRIKGPKGTTVTLTLERGDRTVDLTVTRDLVQVITMRSFRRADIGYIRMDEFNANTARDLEASIKDLQQRAPLKALILDVRFNGGGLLDQAKVISELFLSRGQEIVRTSSIAGDPSVYRSSGRNPYRFPMAVLTSGGSASAAEILAGALQRNDRAVVLGTTSFGKGSVQTIKPQRDGSRLKLTIQEYQLPGGVSIQDVGITPDVALIRHSLDKDGGLARLRPYSREREVDGEFALANRAAYRHEGTYELGWLAAFRTKDEMKQSGISARDFAPDQEATLAIDLMTAALAAPGFDAGLAAAQKNDKQRQFLLKELAAPVHALAEKEAQALGAALAKQTPSIAWGEASTASAGTLKLAFTGPAEISSGAVGNSTPTALTFTVTNTGPTAIGRLYGTIQADKFSPLWEDEIIFGTVAPGATITGTLHFQVPPRSFSGEERFAVDLRATGSEAPLATLPVSINLRAQPRPLLGFDWQIEDPSELKPGVQGFIKVTIRNDGAGPAAAPIARVFKADDPYVQLGDTRFEHLGKDGKTASLAAGDTWEIKVPVTISESVKGLPFKANHISLQVSCQETFDEDSKVDGRYRSGIFSTIKIPVGEKLKASTIRAPRVTLATIETIGVNDVAVHVTVEDDNPQTLSVFQDDDKVDLLTIGEKRSFRFPLALKPGANNIRIVATDNSDVDQVLPIRLWGEGTPENKKPLIKAPVPTSEVP